MFKPKRLKNKRSPLTKEEILAALSPVVSYLPHLGQARAVFPSSGRKLNHGDVGKWVIRIYPLSEKGGNFDWSYTDTKLKVLSANPEASSFVCFNGAFSFSLEEAILDNHWLTVEEFEQLRVARNVKKVFDLSVLSPPCIKTRKLNNDQLWSDWFQRVRQMAPQEPGAVDYSYSFSQFTAPKTSSASFLAEPDFSSNDPYRVLGLPPETPSEQVRKRYRKLALQFHPDKTGDDQFFKKINAAHEKLQNEMQSAEDFIFDAKLNYEENFSRALMYGNYLKRKEVLYSLPEVRMFGSVLEAFMNQLRRLEKQPATDPLIQINLDMLIQHTQADLNYNKTKQVVLSISPVGKELSADERISLISEQILQLSDLEKSADLSNSQETWTANREENFKRANFLVLDQYLSLQRNHVELLSLRGDIELMKKINNSTRNYVARVKSQIKKGLERANEAARVFDGKVSHHMPFREDGCKKEEKYSFPSNENTQDLETTEFYQKTENEIPLSQRLEENVDKQLEFFSLKKRGRES